MSKNLRISFILSLIFAGLLIAWGTISNFFSGVGVPFVSILGILIVLLALILTDDFVKSRTKDIFILACVFTFLELFVYLLLEFGLLNVNGIEGVLKYQMVISILALVYLIYIVFRFLTDLKDIKIGFVEKMLGNQERTKKIKTAKELSNGSLEDKPNKKNIEKNQGIKESKSEDNTMDIEIDEE